MGVLNVVVAGGDANQGGDNMLQGVMVGNNDNDRQFGNNDNDRQFDKVQISNSINPYMKANNNNNNQTNNTQSASSQSMLKNNLSNKQLFNSFIQKKNQ